MPHKHDTPTKPRPGIGVRPNFSGDDFPGVIFLPLFVHSSIRATCRVSSTDAIWEIVWKFGELGFSATLDFHLCAQSKCIEPPFPPSLSKPHPSSAVPLVIGGYGRGGGHNQREGGYKSRKNHDAKKMWVPGGKGWARHAHTTHQRNITTTIARWG